MAFTKPFEDLSKKDVRIAGGKGASLGEMTSTFAKATADKQALYNPIPPGFVVLASAFEEFLRATDLNVELDAILDQVDHRQMHQVNQASEKIHALILGKEMPEEIAKEVEAGFKKLGAKYVAIRSSATSEDSADAAWAGQLESYLNTTKDALLQNVKRCWASLFTPRAIFYRFETPLRQGYAGQEGHRGKISVAVVVQKMIQSEVSGIAFSVHPVTQDRDQMIIESGFGLGEAIVSGSITPDSYVVEKSTKNILDKNITTQERGLFKMHPSTSSHLRQGFGGQAGQEINIWQDIPKEQGEKATLSDEEVLELADLIMNIEKHYGFPVDVEWAREGGKFYIVQSRPITTLK